MRDDELRAVLHGLGIDENNQRAILLLPLVQVAWADGRIQDSERKTIENLARERDLLAGDGMGLLQGWLRFRPSAGYFEKARMALMELWRRAAEKPSDHQMDTPDDLLIFCAEVAKAAGGLFDCIATIEKTERQLLHDLGDALRLDPTTAVQTALATLDEELGSDLTDPTGVEPQTEEVPLMDGPPPVRGRELPARLVNLANGQDLVLSERGASIGRRSDNEIQLQADAKASRRHCRFYREADRWYVADSGSLHGTLVGGERILSRRLFGGEVIEVGNSRIRFHAPTTTKAPQS